MAQNIDLKKYYSEHSDVSRISEKFASGFADAPNEIMMAVRKKMIHPGNNMFNFDGENWPRTPTAKGLEQKFLEQEFVFGTCNHFSMLSVAIMRSKGIPARARCGFAGYFVTGYYDDHWVVEYMQNGKWRLADAQTQMFDLQPGQFINGAVAWILVRKYGFDPNMFGFSLDNEMLGIYYVIGNLVRDASGMTKSDMQYPPRAKSLEFKKKCQKISAREFELYDGIAEMILGEDINGLSKLNLAEILS